MKYFWIILLSFAFGLMFGHLIFSSKPAENDDAFLYEIDRIKTEYEQLKLEKETLILEKEIRIRNLSDELVRNADHLNQIKKQYDEKINSILNPDLTTVDDAVAIIDSAIDRFLKNR